MIEQVLMLLLIIFAFMAVQTPKLRRAVVFMAVFSALSAFAYMLLGAPDVALAEAIIGSTISTVIYLVALQKYRVFTIYYIEEDDKGTNKSHISRRKNALLRKIEKYFFGKELEPQIVYTVRSMEEIKKREDCDLVISKSKENIIICGDKENYQIQSLEQYVNKSKQSLKLDGYNVEFIIEEGKNYESQ